MKKCSKCSKMNNDDVKYCVECGHSFAKNNESKKEFSVEQELMQGQTNKTIKKTKEEALNIVQEIQKKWRNSLYFFEKLIVAGIGVNIISIIILRPPLLISLFVLASLVALLVLIYFSQASEKKKLKCMVWCVAVGSFFVASFLIVSYVVNAMVSYGGYFVSSNLPGGFQIAILLALAGSILIVGASFRLHNHLINKFNNK